MQIENKQISVRVLTPDEGYWLTNGITYSKLVYLGIEADPEDCKEITQEGYENRIEQLDES